MELSFKPKDETTLTLFIDGEKWRDIHFPFFRHLSWPVFSSLEAFERWFNEVEYAKAKAYAYARLAKKNQPKSELERALKGKNVSESTIQRLLKELEEAHYVDDKAFAESYVDHEVARGKGPRAIAYKLHEKGLSQEAIERALKNRETETLPRILKRYSKEDLQNPKERQKALNALYRRGFNFDEAKKWLSKYEEENAGDGA